MTVRTVELKPKHWPEVEKLFGDNGACGGCWCQAWRIDKGESWSKIQGGVARRRLHKGIRNDTTHGVLAFDGETPIGWCTFGPRDSFPRLNRARTLSCDDSAKVWSIPCFFVSRKYRGRGVATSLLYSALATMRRRRVKIVEGYPSKPDKNGRYISAFAWTGTQSLFKKAGFRLAGNRNGSKQRVRIDLGNAKP